jgi:uncharacterized protein (DUF433 family)
MSTLVKAMKHPYIRTDRKIRGGEPVISGTGIRVLDIAVRYEIMGIIVAFPHISLSQIHDALSYYYEHKNDIDKGWKLEIQEVDLMRRKYTSVLESKIGKIKAIHR